MNETFSRHPWVLDGLLWCSLTSFGGGRLRPPFLCEKRHVENTLAEICPNLPPSLPHREERRVDQC